MKILNALILGTLALGTATAQADGLAANAQVRTYLVENGLLSAPINPDRIVATRPADGIDATTRYLADAGLVEAPRVAVRSRQIPVNVADIYSSDGQVRAVLVDWGLLSEPLRDHPDGADIAAADRSEDDEGAERRQ